MNETMYERKWLVPIEVWVTHRSNMGIKHISESSSTPWRAAVRHSNGLMEWQWHKTKKEAIDWCEKFNPQNDPQNKGIS